MNTIENVRRLAAWPLAWADRGRPVALLLVRLSLAAVFVPSGWGKIHDLAKVTAYFTELGIPLPHANAVLVSLTELGCGVLLLLGLLGRLAALPIVANMTVAIITAKRDELHGIVDLFALDEFIYIVLAIAIVALGSGLFSLDALFARVRGRAQPASGEAGGKD
jgi:putative oxidoreductase